MTSVKETTVSLPPLVEPAPELTVEEVARYSRHLIIPDVGVTGQKRLKNAKILVVGAGGLGSPALLYLAAAGVGTLGIVDFDVVDESNLQRQVIHGVSDVGRPKAESAREKFETASERMRARNDWFQGRELVEALGVHVWVHDGLSDRSLARFEEALTMADAADLYVAAWLTAACAEPLYSVARDRVRAVVASYVDRVKGLGYNEINRKLEDILART